MNEKEMRAKIEAMMDKQEQEALAIWKEKVKLDEAHLPSDIKGLIERAFLTGFTMGGIVEEQNFKLGYKADPKGFIEWMKGDK